MTTPLHPLRIAAALLAVGIAGAVASPAALADHFHRPPPRGGYYDRYHHWHSGPAVVVGVGPAPAYVAPPPVVYAPPPAPYAYAPPPVVGLGLNINLR